MAAVSVRRPLRDHVSMEFSYKLTGTGWGEATLVGDGGEAVVLPTSYLTDALGQLLKAVKTLLEGAVRAECSWQEEPGEYRWLFEVDRNDLHIRILEFPEFYTPLPEGEGQQVLSASGPLRDLAAVIARGAGDVLIKYGEDGYVEDWIRHPFPTGVLRTVEKLLND